MPLNYPVDSEESIAGRPDPERLEPKEPTSDDMMVLRDHGNYLKGEVEVAEAVVATLKAAVGMARSGNGALSLSLFRIARETAKTMERSITDQIEWLEEWHDELGTD